METLFLKEETAVHGFQFHIHIREIQGVAGMCELANSKIYLNYSFIANSLSFCPKISTREYS